MEAFIVGLVTLVIGTTLSILFMYTQDGFSIKKIDFWPTLILTNFFTGVIVHLLCEWSGINKWYCKNGHACRK